MTELSDHLPVFTCIGSQKTRTKSPIKIKSRKLNNDIINSIKTSIKQLNWIQLEHMDADEAYKCFTEKITNVIDMHAPEREITIMPNNVIRNKWLTKGPLKSSRNCDKLYKKSLKLPKTDKMIKYYIKYRNLYNKLRRIAKITYYGQLLQESKNDIKKHGKL
jgi:hypothetical protein